MKTNTTKLLALSLVATFIFSFTACGTDSKTASEQTGQASTSVSTQSEATAETVKKAPEKITFSMFQQWKKDALVDVVKLYEEKSGNTVEIQVFPDDQYENLLKTKLATGDASDVFYYYTTLKPLPKESLETLEGDWVAKVRNVSILKDADGRVVCAPIGGCSALGMMYNKEVLKSAGIGTVPTTYSDLIKACEAIKAKGITPLYIPNKDPWTAQILSLVGYDEVFAENSTLGDDITKNKVKLYENPGIKDMNQKILDLKTKGYINKDYMSATYQMALEAVAKGKAAFFACPDAFANTVQKDYPDEYAKTGMAPFSFSDKRTHVTIGGAGGAVYVFTDSKVKDAAKDFVSFLMSDDAIKAYFAKEPGIPALDGIDVSMNDWDKELQSYAKTMPVEGQWMDAYTPKINIGDFALAWQSIFAGKDATKALEDWYKSIIPLNKALKLEGWN